MRFIRLVLHLLASLKKNTTMGQFLLFVFLFLILILLGIVTFIKVIIPFTYIAL